MISVKSNRVLGIEQLCWIWLDVRKQLLLRFDPLIQRLYTSRV